MNMHMGQVKSGGDDSLENLELETGTSKMCIHAGSTSVNIMNADDDDTEEGIASSSEGIEFDMELMFTQLSTFQKRLPQGNPSANLWTIEEPR